MIQHHALLWLHRLTGRFFRSANGKPQRESQTGEGIPSPGMTRPTEPSTVSSPSDSWLVASASIAGSGHVRRGLGSDDWYEVHRHDSLLIVVVADGMGSARFGAIGARAAAKAVSESLASRPVHDTMSQWRMSIRHAFGLAQADLERLAENLSLSAKEFATTAICAIVSKDFVVMGQVGDGALVIRFTDGQTMTASLPSNGMYANETAALGIGEEVLVSKSLLGPVSSVAVFTDGLERIALDRHRPYIPFLDPLWHFLSERPDDPDWELSAFLASDRVQRATDDDCTLVLAQRASGGDLA